LVVLLPAIALIIGGLAIALSRRRSGSEHERGAAGGILASHLPGFPVQAGIAVAMGAAAVGVLRLPVSAAGP
jgi:hypothetical protein